MTKQTLFGWHPVLEAIASGKEIQRIFLLRGARNERSAELLKVTGELGIPVQFVPQQKLDRITRKNHQGVIAELSPVEFADLDNLLHMLYERGESPAILALDGVTDVGNFGAICRSVEGLGFHAVLIPTKGAAPLNEDAVKTSSGALLRIPVCRTSNFGKTLRQLRDSGLSLVGMTEKASTPLHEVIVNTPLCVVMGNEEVGLSEASLKNCEVLSRIHMNGDIASLNVSVSAAIAMYHFSMLRRVAIQ